MFERPDRARADDSAANEALATAFRGEAFSAADLETYMKNSRPDDRAGEHVQKLEALHAILTPEQRATFADEIQENGFMGGRGKHDRKWEKKGDGEAGAKFVAHKVEKLCAPLSCTDDQEQKIAAIVAQAKAERPERGDRDHTALADAMRAETFDTAAVQKELEAAKSEHEERHAGKADALVAIHGVLDANQRDMVADRIEAEGPGAILGHRGGPRGDKHGKFGKKRARG